MITLSEWDSIMPEPFYSLMQSVLSRLLTLWVKPDVLPDDPQHLIDVNKPVLYILEVGGAADYTALQIACARHLLPAPGKALAYGSISESSSVDVLQRRRGSIFRRHRNVQSKRLSRLVEAGVQNDSDELQIVPVSIYWGRAPDKEGSFWGLLFTENWQLAGRTRKFITTLIHGRHTLVSFSEPLSFNALKSSGESPQILQRKVSRILRVHFRQRRIASLGPDQSHRRILIDHVLSDPAVRQAIVNETKGNTSPQRAQLRAQKYALEIAADVSYPTVRILQRLLTKLWNQLYDGVELSGVDRLKAVADGNEIVYVPCHRSHIDYLLLSYILYMQGFSLPHIAAGVNLNLPVVGGLLRRGGAFFLRRSFSGNPLYATVFSAYLQEILQRGNALEYFVEGGRSRTGRLLPPKGGMLAMTTHAFLRNTRTPVVFIPIYLGYERLLEGRAFTSELAGGKKQRESIFALLKSLRTLKEDYGRVYVNIGKPIALNQLLDQHRPEWRSLPVNNTRPEWIKPIMDDLGITIMRSINEAASVTPISVLATTLLAAPNGCMSRKELLRQIDVYQTLLKETHLGSLVEVPDIDAEELIEHGMRLRFIDTQEDAIGPMISLRAGQAAPMTYFRNNILHLLTLPSLVAAAFTNNRTQSDENLRKLIRLTFPFLQGELFLNTDVDDSAIDQTVEALKAAGLLSFEQGYWRRAPISSAKAIMLMRIAQVVTPALERYYLFACVMAVAPGGAIGREQLAQRCKNSAARLARTHDRQEGELYDKHLHKAFIQNLIKQKYIQADENMLKPTSPKLNMEAEARTLLGEQVRQAIFNTALAATEAASNDSLPAPA